MKRSRLLSLALPFLLLGVTSAKADYSERTAISNAKSATDGINLLSNSGFGSTSFSSTGWTTWSSDPVAVATGGSTLGLTTTGTTPGTSPGAVLIPKSKSVFYYQDEPVEPGERFLVAGWARCRAAGENSTANMQARFLDANGAYITVNNSYEKRANFAADPVIGWQPTMFMITVPWNAATMRVMINATGGDAEVSGTQGYAFDDIQVYNVRDFEVPPVAPLTIAPPDITAGTHVINDAYLQETKAKLIEQGIDATQVPDYFTALGQIKAKADPGMDRTTYLSVVADGKIPSGGTIHDYYTQAAYWWPHSKDSSGNYTNLEIDDSDKDGDGNKTETFRCTHTVNSAGEPYYRRDGKGNPDNSNYWDGSYVTAMCQEVKAIALAHYFGDDNLRRTGDPAKAEYGTEAVNMIRTWFLNSSTKMNPNLTYSQIIRGVNGSSGAGTALGTGTIDMEKFVDVLDAIQILKNSPSSGWTSTDQSNMEAWVTSYLNWLLTSAQGQDAANDPNNIRTHYELQVVACQMFLGQNANARTRLQNTIMPLVQSQFSANGSQPQETARTKPWTYSIKNLSAWFRMATIAQALGIDLWDKTYTVSGDTRSVKEGFTYMLGYAKTPANWPYISKEAADPVDLRAMARTASVMWPDLQDDVESILSSTDVSFRNGEYQTPFGVDGVLLVQQYAFLPGGF